MRACSDDPCLAPCDPRSDACCDELHLLAVVQRELDEFGCDRITGLAMTWTTPVPPCVLLRAGVTDVSGLTFEFYVQSSESADGTPDATVAGSAINDGTMLMTREELALGDDCTACVEDLDICMVVKKDGVVQMRCFVCPEGCDDDGGGSGSGSAALWE